MRITLQRRLAAQIMGCSEKRVRFKTEELDSVKEAITKVDIKGLIKKGTISKIQAKGVSRYRARIRARQKKKGRRRGHGTRKGSPSSRVPKKKKWMSKVRLQRNLLKGIREEGAITPKAYKVLYMKVKGGFFRSKRHLMLYIEEQGIKK